MKTYEEMIQYTVDQIDNGTLRYFEWPAVMVLAEAYGVPRDTAFGDVKFEKDQRVQAQKDRRRADSRADHEERRLANLAKKVAV